MVGDGLGEEVGVLLDKDWNVRVKGLDFILSVLFCFLLKGF